MAAANSSFATGHQRRESGQGGDLSLSALSLSPSTSASFEDNDQGESSRQGSSPPLLGQATAASSGPSYSTTPLPPSRAWSASSDSVTSGVSGKGYYSAEEDIGEGKASDNEDAPKPGLPMPFGPTSASSPSSSPPPTPTAASQRRKGKGKAAPIIASPPVPITPRRASLGKVAKSSLPSSAGSSSNSTHERDLAFPSPGKGIGLGAPLGLSTSAQPMPKRSSSKGLPGSGVLSSESIIASSNSQHSGSERPGSLASEDLSEGRSASRQLCTSAGPSTTETGLGLDSADCSLANVTQPNYAIDEDDERQLEKKLLQRWILSIGCVNFDLERGPDLESLSPHLDISREERDSIAFSSFPDTSIFDEGSLTFSFRAREVPLEASVSSPPRFGTAPSSRRPSQSEDHSGKPAAVMSEKSEIPLPFRNPRRQDTGMSTASSQAALSDCGDTGRASSVTGGTGKISNSSKTSYLYGYVFFCQRRDPSIRRGYFQKSLVILSHLPYVALFGEIVSKLGPLYFQHGDSILESFSDTVTKWPNPSPGATLPLPLFGSVLWAALPLGRQGQASGGANVFSNGLGDDSTLSSTAEATKAATAAAAGRRIGPGAGAEHQQPPRKGWTEEEPLLASIPQTPLVSIFREALADLWLVWECVLLAEPILVLGPDPKMCSEAVWHLLDICRPIPHAGDFRPFFTIHDYDFKNLATRKQPPAGTLIGCTNPFMAQICSHWPHVLRVGKAAVKLGTAGKYGRSGNAKVPSGGGVAGGAGPGGGGPEHLPGFATKRKRRVSKDRPLLKKLSELVEKEENLPMANAMLRRYFADITERFLSPLNRYISSLIPSSTLEKGHSVDASQIKPFNTDAFLASLKAHGTPLPLRSRSLPTGAAVRQGLYLDFVKSPNFSYYLTERLAYYRTRNPVPSSAKTRFESQASR
ncbi:unnamed protein product [Jaminaea pallidilutea]